MLYQDQLTGMLHEVPDGQVYGWGLGEDPYGMGEGQIVYDGLGNPLGWGFFKKIGGLLKKAVPLATSMLGPYGQIINRALPIASKILGPSAQGLLSATDLEGLPLPGPIPIAPMAPGAPRPFPYGWRRPAVPYAGPHPHRLYLRCSTWHGPRGLVPGGPLAPTTAVPVATPVPGAVAPVPGARPRFRRRRR
jgi:hypothetical protein